MRILVLSTRLPHHGVISGHVIVRQRLRRLLRRGHEVGLATFLDSGDEPHVEEVREGLLSLRTVPVPARRGPVGRLRRAFSAVPRPFSDWTSEAMCRAVGDLVERDRYDVALAEFSSMGPFLHHNPYLSAVRRVLSCHQCATVASQTRIDVLGYSPRGLIERLRRERLRRYEFDLYHNMDRVLVLTPQERYQLLDQRPDLRTAVVPRGVDTDYFRPPDEGAAVRRDTVLYTGYYSHEPNRDAVRWFATRVWPRVRDRYPGLTFTVVGPYPPPEMYDLVRRDKTVMVTGEVDDVRAYLRRARVFVCPVRMGSGMRGKILEAMACRVPVVATSLGAEGIPVLSGENCFLADDAAIMAQRIDLLLSDESLARRIAEQGRRTVAERLSWERSVDLLEAVLQEVAGRASARRQDVAAARDRSPAD